MTKKQTNTLLAILVVGLVALVAYFVAASSASAFNHGGDDTDVTNTNEAQVSNGVSVTALTGDNVANGGDGDKGGDGGDATVRGGDRAVAGDGGRGGNGGDAGTVQTGGATAIGTVENTVNTNRTYVEGCGCDDDFDGPVRSLFMPWFGGGGDDITVTNRNRASVQNGLEVTADTGYNDADGGDGDKGGSGGDATASERNLRLWWWWSHGGDAIGGNGGNGGNGGAAGSVVTGPALADGLVTNVVNRNVTRVTRGATPD